MATSFLTQLVELAYDADMNESAYSGVISVPVYGPAYDVYKFQPIKDPGFKGRARDDANRFGAAWAEFKFYMEMGGFDEFDDGGTEYNPPVWGRLCKAMAMKDTDGTADGNWAYEVDDKIHLSDDTVHVSEFLNPLTSIVNIDGYYFAIDKGVMNGTFSMDVDEGPPRLTITSYMGNIYKDTSNNYYWYPTTDVPAGIGSVTEYLPPRPVDAANATLTLSVVPNDGTYTPVAVTGICLRRWEHNVGNQIGKQSCMNERFKRGQFFIRNQNDNKATLVVKVQDPGTYSAPATFNPYKMVENRDMIDFSLVHNSGVANEEITFICDYYISEVVGVKDDGEGVLEYTLTLQQASLTPDMKKAQYLKISVT